MGMTTSAWQPSDCADKATPWAWFPADEQMTPLLNCSRGSLAIML